MSYLRLLKLLYIADREALREVARPIVGTRPVAMPHGPVLSEVYDLVRGEHFDEAIWSEHIRKDGYEIELTKDPGVLTLSRYEIGVLTRTAEANRDTDDWELVRKTHSFPEWVRNYREGTSTPIPFEDLIEAVGRSEDRDEILEDAEETTAVRRFFGCPV
ncbi:MAG: Panacea domain-containing protein [Armatimonadota bacterium]